MEEKELKTSLKQRIFISVIAVAMLGSMVGAYAMMILGNSQNNNSSSEGISEEKKMEYEDAYFATLEKFRKASKTDFNKFIKYKSRIAAYN